eukprot:6366153-Alexandrium_andersonii.AAC.1
MPLHALDQRGEHMLAHACTRVPLPTPACDGSATALAPIRDPLAHMSDSKWWPRRSPMGLPCEQRRQGLRHPTSPWASSARQGLCPKRRGA